MDIVNALGTSWNDLLTVVISAVAVYLVVIVFTRLTGPRALAKMSSFDFAATVAMGSTIASTATGSSSLTTGVLVLALLFALQYAIATLRRRDVFRGAVDNAPLLLMAGTQVLEGNLRHARISRSELWAQLRLAGVQQLDDVRAVVLETTGDLSVLTGPGPIADELLDGVRGASALTA